MLHLFLLPLLGLTGPVTGQDLPSQTPPSPSPPVFTSGTDLVNLTVSVRDGEGHLVSDLGPEDFVVWEDGRPQNVQVFARAVEPEEKESLALDLGLLLDTSESMLKQLKLSQQAAIRFLDAIPRARDLLTIFFDQDIRISRYDSEHQQGLIERILDVKGGGNTALYDAIAVCLSRIQDAQGRKVMVLFTDGEDSTSELNLGQVLALIRSSSVTIYSIAFTDGLPKASRLAPARAFLKEVADLTGGEVFSPTASRDLPAIYEKILDELRTQYVLGYASDNARHDGRFRKLKVEVKRNGLKVRHRAGYTVPVNPPRD